MSTPITLEFGGGLDVLFGGQKSINCQVPSKTDGSQLLLPDILKFMKDELLEERPELFLQGDTVRPGILVIINDTDYELTGGDESEINKDDRITFISTLHGG